MSNTPTYLSCQEVADRLRTTCGTLANQRHQGRSDHPVYIKFGNRVLYPLAELIEWEDRHRVGADV